MSLEPLPFDIDVRVRQYADKQHLSHDQAVIKLLEEGLNSAQSGGIQHNPQVEEILENLGEIRADRARFLAGVTAPNESAGRLIGILADEPEAVKAIENSVRE